MAVMESTGPFVGDSEAEAWLTARRWPDGVRCPRCERAHPAQRHRRSLRHYRCRHCRCEFTVTSGTALHATKLGLARWAKAAYASDSGPPALAALLGVSAPTARRVSCLLDRGESRGASRFAALLNPCPAEADRWQAPVLPPTMSRSDDPIAGMAAGEKAVMNALRHRQMGATVAAVGRPCRTVRPPHRPMPAYTPRARPGRCRPHPDHVGIQDSRSTAVVAHLAGRVRTGSGVSSAAPRRARR